MHGVKQGFTGPVYYASEGSLRDYLHGSHYRPYVKALEIIGSLPNFTKLVSTEVDTSNVIRVTIVDSWCVLTQLVK